MMADASQPGPCPANDDALTHQLTGDGTSTTSSSNAPAASTEKPCSNATPQTPCALARACAASQPPPTTRMGKVRAEVRRRILHFTASWFSVNMGTGIVSILLHNLPYQFRGLGVIADVVFGLNVALFAIFLVMAAARFLFFRNMFALSLLHPQQSLFWGTLPMGFGTIVNMVALACAPAWGRNWAELAWALWWIESLLAVMTAIGIPFLQFTRHDQSWETLTAAWLLPIVAPVVASASGGIVADALRYDPSRARLTIIVSYVLWGIGVLPAFLVYALVWARLAIHKLPPAAVIVTAFLPLGPCGLGGFALMQLSSVLRKVTMADSVAPFGGASLYDGESAVMMANALYVVSIPCALIMWGLGFVWLTLAIASVTDMWCAHAPGLPFNIGFWGFAFPIGVYGISTIQLGKELDSGAFRVLGTILALAVTIIWLFCLFFTLKKAVTGELFFSPCLTEAGGEPPRKIDASRASRKYPHVPRPPRSESQSAEGASRSRSRVRIDLSGVSTSASAMLARAVPRSTWASRATSTERGRDRRTRDEAQPDADLEANV